MSLFNLDDHYNQTRYRHERDGFVMSTIKDGQRWNYPFLFGMAANKGYWFNTQAGHKSHWFIQKA